MFTEVEEIFAKSRFFMADTVQWEGAKVLRAEKVLRTDFRCIFEALPDEQES
jgi:hypothetical protein